MRPLNLLLPATLLALASSAGAQSLPYPQADSPSSQVVEVTAPARSVRLKEEEARQVEGTYAMSNGWRMKVQATQRYIDARIDRQRPLRLRAVSPDRFVSADGNVAMEFNKGDWREDMTMSYVPDPRVAQVVVISARMAQR
jgi:hypothetical protein